MPSKDCSDHDAAVLNGMLASTKIATESLKTLKAENFGSYDAKLLFRLIGDLHSGKEEAREQTWPVLQRMRWTLPGDTEGEFSEAIIRCKAWIDRNQDIRATIGGMQYIGMLHSDPEELLADALARLAKFGSPRLTAKTNYNVSQEKETVSKAAQGIAQEALRLAAEKPGELPQQEPSQKEINRKKLEEFKAKKAAKEQARQVTAKERQSAT